MGQNCTVERKTKKNKLQKCISHILLLYSEMVSEISTNKTKYLFVINIINVFLLPFTTNPLNLTVFTTGIQMCKTNIN